MSNVEADRQIRDYIETNGRELQSKECISGTGNEIVAVGVMKTKEIKVDAANVANGVGFVACKAIVILPGHEKLFAADEANALVIGLELSWNEEPNSVSVGGRHDSAATYLLHPSDPQTLDEYYRTVAQYNTSYENLFGSENEGELTDEQAALLKSDPGEMPLPSSQFVYLQTKPEIVHNEEDQPDDPAVMRRASDQNDNHAEVIRIFQNQHPYLAMLSTQNYLGHVSETEIPQLAAWLTIGRGL